MNKVVKIIIAIVLVVLIVVGIVFLIDLDRMNNNQEVLFSTWGRDYTPKTSRNNTTIENMVNNNISENKIGTNTDENTISGSDVENNDSNEIGIVTSLEDKISDDSAWCGTFNLVWNDLKNDLAKQDIVFNPQLDMVKNLNKGTFNVSQLSENSYYKVYGRPTFQLKSQIEKAIKDKFNETSKILDDFEWSDDATGYFLYSMLKKKFEFPKEFTKLSNGKFRNYNNVKYFGIDEKTSDEVKAQLEVLYYNSKDNFAIKINTKQSKK